MQAPEDNVLDQNDEDESYFYKSTRHSDGNCYIFYFLRFIPQEL